MVPAHATVKFELAGRLKVEVGTKHLSGIQTLCSTPKASTSASAGKAAVIHIIGVAHEHNPRLVFEKGSHKALGVTVVRTDGSVGIGKYSLVHTPLYAEVEHGLLLSVINAGHFGQVALLVVGLDFVYYRRGKVLQSRLRVAGHELLAVHQHLFHLLAIDGYGAVVAYLRTGQTLYKLFHNRAFGRSVCRGVIYKRVFLHRNARRLTNNRGLFKHDCISTERYAAERNVLVARHLDTLCQRCISNACKL